MSKDKITFFCNECGGETSKWQGQCPHCKAWNTLVEEKFTKSKSKNVHTSYYSNSSKNNLINLSDVEVKEISRFSTKISEFDRVLGGGLVDGAVILLGGDPGIGKSTLLLQSLSLMADSFNVLYVSGEESSNQIALRAQRLSLNTNNIKLLSEIEL